ncbi:MAG: PTS sugar transporter subunit IIA [Elusimicrobia bacterium]|nr:PTS sugar transporter subunit IIA [Elusimicrobiota bacterium]
MTLLNHLTPEAVSVDLKAPSRDGVLSEMVELLRNGGRLPDAAAALEAVRHRELQGSTGCGSGVAVPHARVAGLKQPMVAVGISRKGVDFAAVDGQPVNIFFLVLGPQNAPESFLKLLSQIARLVRVPEVRGRLSSCGSATEVIELIRDESAPI